MSDIINLLALIAICTSGIFLWLAFKRFDDILNKKVGGAFDEAKNDATESINEKHILELKSQLEAKLKPFSELMQREIDQLQESIKNQSLERAKSEGRFT